MVTLAFLLMSGATLVFIAFHDMRQIDVMLKQLESTRSQHGSPIR